MLFIYKSVISAYKSSHPFRVEWSFQQSDERTLRVVRIEVPLSRSSTAIWIVRTFVNTMNYVAKESKNRMKALHALTLPQLPSPPHFRWTLQWDGLVFLNITWTAFNCKYRTFVSFGHIFQWYVVSDLSVWIPLDKLLPSSFEKNLKRKK